MDAENRDTPLMALDQYMRWIKQIPRLTGEEEAQLLRRIACGAREQKQACPNAWRLQLAAHARVRLVEAYQPLVITVAHRFVRRCESLQLLDLIQEGSLGVMQAIEAYGEGQGCSLRTLVVCRVQDAMWHAVMWTDRMVRIPRRQWEQVKRVCQAEEEFMAVYGCAPTEAELAAATGFAEHKVRELLLVRHRERVESLQGLVEHEDAEGVLQFRLLDETGVAVEMVDYDRLLVRLQAVWETALTPRQQELISLRYGIGPHQGQPERLLREMAVALGSSATTVRRHELQARDVLREALLGVGGGAQEEEVA